MSSQPATFTVRIEVPRGNVVKYSSDDSIDFVSPLPCPFNYGSVHAFTSDDGDPLDAIILGRRIRRGAHVEGELATVVHFRDAGAIDDKLILCPTGRRFTTADRYQLTCFFTVYAFAKRMVQLLGGQRGLTRFEGFGEQARGVTRAS